MSTPRPGLLRLEFDRFPIELQPALRSLIDLCQMNVDGFALKVELSNVVPEHAYVGNFLEALKQLGVTPNRMVFATSDARSAGDRQ